MIPLTTRTGFRFDVRPSTAADREAVGAFFDQVSDEDRRFRFLSAVQHLTAAQIDDMTDDAPDRHVTFLGFCPDNGDLIAAATLGTDPQHEIGEVAISIRADHKGRGIGWTLLDHVAEQARGQGIRKLQSIESRENHAAILLEKEKGFSASAVDGDPTLVLLEKQF